MRIKINNLAPENQRFKIIKTPSSAVNLGPQPGAIGESETAIFGCLSPTEQDYNLFSVFAVPYEGGEKVIATGDFGLTKVFKRSTGSNTFTEKLFDPTIHVNHIAGAEAKLSADGGTMVIHGGADVEGTRFPIEFFKLNDDTFTVMPTPTLQVNDCQQVINVAVSGTGEVVFVVYLALGGQRRQCFFILEGDKFVQRPTQPSTCNNIWLNWDGTLLLAPQFQQIEFAELFDVNKVSGTIGEKYEIDSDFDPIKVQLMIRTTFPEASSVKDFFVSRYNSVERWRWDSTAATVKSFTCLNATNVAEIGNYPTEKKTIIDQAFPGPPGKMILVASKDGNFINSIACMDTVDVNGVLVGSINDAIGKGVLAGDYVAQQHGIAYGPVTNNIYYSYGKGIVALAIRNETNELTEVARS